jgi:hypothetical protein
MIQRASESEWQRFTAQLRKARAAGDPILPMQAPYRGVLPGNFDYVLPDDLFACLRDWLYGRGETDVLYFLTETADSQAGDDSFVLSLWDLREDALSEVNSGFESVLTGSDFAWALFIDHEGKVHVAGPPELYNRLAACTEAGGMGFA